jgi:3-phenylpropionate/trans-cinnamate dioxygenase ferredoxin subunit
VSEERASVDIGGLDDFTPNSVALVNIGKLELGIIRWGEDEVFAVHNRCPHMAGPLCVGALGPRLACPSGDPERLEVDDENPVLACPWHRWEFDVRTGRALWDPGYRMKTYPARIADGRVLVELGRPAAAETND